MIIKAAAISNLTDARFFAAYGVDYIGFCFDPLSPDYISPQNALAIKGWISGPKIVAEFANQDIDNIKNIVTFFEPDVIEITDAEAALPEIKNFNLPVIIKTSFNQLQHIENFNWLFVLVDAAVAQKIPAKEFPLMIDVSDYKQGLEDIQVKAVQIRGSAETEVGVKDYDALADLIESLSAN